MTEEQHGSLRLSTSQRISSFSTDSLIYTKFLNINVTYDGVLKYCVFQLSFIKGGTR